MVGVESMHLVKLFRRFRRDESGVAAMEYGLIAGFISLVIVAGLLIASPAISAIYSTIGSDLSNACNSMGGTSC
jgi:pilus assembly protein Flp/PilA